MIVENPKQPPHYLTYYFPVKPSIIDTDRTNNGDYYKKPTQYWFVNCEPEQNIVFEALEYVEKKTIEHLRGSDRQRERSMIHPQYARRFILQYLVDKEKYEQEN